jgi:ABC-2 type transport system permease protein
MPHIYWMEIKTEFLKLARMRAYTIFTVLFPLMFYCFFGLAMGQQSMAQQESMGQQGPNRMPPIAMYLLATYGVFGVIGATLYGFGIGVAVERGLGWLELKRASPMPAGAYLAAKGVVSLFFGALVVALLFTLGAVFGDVRMPPVQWLELGATLIAGAIPFCALGLAIGNFAGPNSASAVVNTIYMPMAFCGGLWIPYDFLPHGLQHFAPLLPTFHFAQLALAVLHAPIQGSVGTHLEALVAYALLFSGLAWILQARGREKMYG